jgi:hypothetical protein
MIRSLSGIVELGGSLSCICILSCFLVIRFFFLFYRFSFQIFETSRVPLQVCSPPRFPFRTVSADQSDVVSPVLSVASPTIAISLADPSLSLASLLWRPITASFLFLFNLASGSQRLGVSVSPFFLLLFLLTILLLFFIIYSSDSAFDDRPAARLQHRNSVSPGTLGILS